MAQYVLLPSGFYHRVDDDTGPYVQSTPGVFAIVATGTGGGGGGGAVTIADGADVTQGAVADAVIVAGAAGTVSSKLRAISRDIGTLAAAGGSNAAAGATGAAVPASAGYTGINVGGNLVGVSAANPMPGSVADGADVVIGAVADAAAAAGGTGTVSAKLRRISTQLPAALGSAAAASSLAATASTEDVARTGIITEAAPATDTASSGLNGRLQRIAQRLTSLIALFPTALGATVQANSLPVVLPTDPDSRPASGNITVVDSATTSTASSPVVNGQPINSITGAPTANSFLTTAINGFELARTQITGVWTGTLTFEVSTDGGTTYQASASHVSGTTIESATAVANGQFITLVAAATHFRVRATAAMTGTATVKTTYGTSGGIIKANGGLVNVMSPPSLNLASTPSGSITAGNTAQNAAAANTNRRGFALQNLSSGDLWFSSLATAVQDQPSLKLAAGAYYETPPGAAGVGAISIIGATTGQKYSGREW